MTKKILWIEDDYFAIKSLVRPLEKKGLIIVPATSAYDGYKKAQGDSYDLIIVDLILPLSDTHQNLPEEILSWNREEYVGVGLVKALKTLLVPDVPILMLSVVRDPITKYNLGNLKLAGCLPKRALKPSEVKREVFNILGIDEKI